MDHYTSIHQSCQNHSIFPDKHDILWNADENDHQDQEIKEHDH
jgi:hypothetical protein